MSISKIEVRNEGDASKIMEQRKKNRTSSENIPQQWEEDAETKNYLAGKPQKLAEITANKFRTYGIVSSDEW